MSLMRVFYEELSSIRGPECWFMFCLHTYLKYYNG